MLLVAPHVLPIEGATYSPGAIRVDGNRIVEIGDPSSLRSAAHGEEILELDRIVITPGFVNAHCHLELTALGPLTLAVSSSNVPFVDWIRTLIREKNALNTGKMAKGMRRGIGKLLDSGVTTVGDHISFDGDWKTIVDSPLKGILFGEVLGVLPEVCNDIYSTLRQIKQDIQTYGHTDIQTSRLSFHITPHSVHAVHPQTLEGIARGETGPFSIHLAESREEDDYFRKEAGPFIDLITERGIPPPHGRTTTIDFLLKMGFPLSELIAIH